MSFTKTCYKRATCAMGSACGHCERCGEEKAMMNESFDPAINPQQSYAAIAYEAYRAHTDGISLVSGRPIPPWESLNAEIKAAWRASAMAVVKIAQDKQSTCTYTRR